MRRRRVSRRKRTFVDAEGTGEQSLATWLQKLCNEEGLKLHLDVKVVSGGDPRTVVEHAVSCRKRLVNSFGECKSVLVLLDEDRVASDREKGKDPETVNGRNELQRFYLAPNLEGLFVRLHCGYENRKLTTTDTKRHLKNLWSTYKKPESAGTLGKQFCLGDLLRAAKHDDGLCKALKLLGLSEAKSN